MQFYEVTTNYIITDIKEHSTLKPTLLDLIDQMPNGSTDTISKSDFFLPSDIPRPYLDLFLNHMEKYMMEMMSKLGCNKWYMQNGWYQQYNSSDSHYWHVHPFCMYNNVYYLELPDHSVQTEFYNPITKQTFFLNDVKEGQMITFPANLIHRSPPNTNKDRKSVIAFNSDFDEVL